MQSLLQADPSLASARDSDEAIPLHHARRSGYLENLASAYLMRSRAQKIRYEYLLAESEKDKSKTEILKKMFLHPSEANWAIYQWLDSFTEDSPQPTPTNLPFFLLRRKNKKPSSK